MEPEGLSRMNTRTFPLVCGAVVLVVVLVITGIRPFSRGTWLLEVLPVLVVLPVLWLTHRRFPLTSVLYLCIFVHAIVLMVGGAYTYARVPFGFQLQEWLDLARNPYDRIGHFMQGFVPALAAREILTRGRYVRTAGMLAFLVICVVMAVSATYELIEWVAALALGQGAEDFLGTQGDVWDTQSDMFCALLGAIAALVLLSRMQDRQIGRIEQAQVAS
jgi:putative membrane protein